jgi:phage baseplate assembly protein W
MSGISVKIPLRQSSTDGFGTTKTIEEVIRQNLKTLLLTRKGERVMDPGFGAGISGYLFENFTAGTYAEIEQAILEQTSIYMPQISIKNIVFDTSLQDRGVLSMRIEFRIAALGVTDILDLPILTRQRGATPDASQYSGNSTGPGLIY